MFDLGNILSTVWTFGSSLFGGKGDDLTDALDPGFGDNFGSSTAMGFIQKGAQKFLESQDKDSQLFAQAPTIERARPVKSLTRGTAVGQVSLPEIQQRLYQNPEVSRYWEALLNSQNSQLQNLRAATSQEVAPTVRSGRKTKVISESTLKGEVGV